MLALAPIRKNKGQTAGLFAFASITVMLLSIGITLFFGIDRFFDERAEANYAPHFAALYYSGADAIGQGQKFMEHDARVVEIEKTYAVGGLGEYLANGVKAMNGIMVSRVDGTQKMDAPSFIGEYLPLTGDRVYIPYYTYLDGGFSMGDEFTLFISGTELVFTIAGTTEDITFGTQLGPFLRFYISDERFDKIENEFLNNRLTVLTARLENADDTVFFQTDYYKEVSTDGLLSSFGYDAAKMVRTMLPAIISVVITAFALILLGVSLIVIRFRIVNSIEESMANIGTQKAIGYRNIQIISALVTQYGLVALIGGLIGVILAGVVLPLIAKVLEPSLALVWSPGFELYTAVISILLVLLTVTLIAYMTSRKINTLHPLVALRGGMAVHSFRKNSFPLSKSRGPLSLLLSLKQIAQSKKQTITIGLIVAAVTMAAVAGIAINYSMNDGRDAFARTGFGELGATDAIAGLLNGDDGEAFQKRIAEYPEVRKVLRYESTGERILVDEINTYLIVTEDCSLLEGALLVSGFYPRHENEIALGPGAIRATGKKAGDKVTIQNSGIEKEYIITGIIQMIENAGLIGLMTADGAREVMPEFMFTIFNIYLNEGVDVESFIERVQAAEGGILDTIINTYDQVGVVFDGMGGMFAAAAYGILAVTVFVIVLTLYMVIKTTILRRRRELGIQKAVGFTTWQLMNQIALNMTPAILLGVAAGAAAGYFGFNPLMSALTSGVGIARLNLPVPLDQIIVVCAALVVLAYAVSMLIAWRIRKISAYALVSE
jgi:putative ABC transport system permease protein